MKPISGATLFFALRRMKPPCTSPLYRVNECLTTTLGLTLNAILILLIVFRTPKELRVYSRVLLCGCCFEILFALNCWFIDEVCGLTSS